MPWSLSQSRQPELMDDPAIAEADHVHALRALATINTVSRTAAGITAAVERILADDASHTDDPIVVDVACGGGDVTVDIARRLHRRGLRRVRVVGVDISPRAVQQSRALAARSGIDAAPARDALPRLRVGADALRGGAGVLGDERLRARYEAQLE